MKSKLIFEREIRDNTKTTVTCLNKNKSGSLSIPLYIYVGSNKRVKLRADTRKFRRGIAENKKTVVITCCVGYGHRVLTTHTS